MTQIACASPQLCVSVASDHTVVAFDPRSATGLRQTASAGRSFLNAVACASVSECVLLGEEGSVRTFDPATDAISAPSQQLPLLPPNGLAGLSCPADQQCAAFYSNGKVATFDPQANGPLRLFSIDPDGGGVNAIACPLASQCTLVDNDEGEVTFNPLTGTAGPRVVVAPDGGPIPALACPSSEQCTLVDAAGDAVTFDPARPARRRLTDNAHLFGVAASGPHRHPHANLRLSLSVLAGDQQPSDRIAAFTLVLPSGFRLASSLAVVRGALTLTTGADNAPAVVQTRRAFASRRAARPSS